MNRLTNDVLSQSVFLPKSYDLDEPILVCDVKNTYSDQGS
jgi:nitrogen fixation protein